MCDCKPCSIPVDTHSKLTTDGALVPNPTHYRSIVGVLQYLTFTRLDIAYTVQQIYRHMHDLWEPHLSTNIRNVVFQQISSAVKIVKNFVS